MGRRTAANAARAQITAANQRNSPLLRLPAELRNQIYTYALGGHILEMGIHWPVVTHIDKSYLHMKKYAAVFALLKTCSQIDAEASTLAYSLNTFSFPEYSDITSFTALFAGKREIRAIREISITYDVVRMTSPADLWSKLSCFRGLEEIKINFAGSRRYLQSTEYTQTWLRILLRLLQNDKPSVRVMTWNSIAGLSSVEYH